MPRPFIFQEISKLGKSLGFNPQASRKAKDWFRTTAKSVKEINVNRLHGNTPSRMTTKIGPADIGQMFTFFYDPKHKDSLPYWDQHPLILPFHVDGKCIKAYNLHYISPYQRAKMLDGLYTISERYGNEIVRTLPISYGYLKGLSKFAPLKPCIKMYLWPHVMSRFMWIRPEEWDMAVMLPLARWAGSTPHSVYRDSARKWKGV